MEKKKKMRRRHLFDGGLGITKTHWINNVQHALPSLGTKVPTHLRVALTKAHTGRMHLNETRAHTKKIMIPLTTSNDKCQDPYENGTLGLMLRPYFII